MKADNLREGDAPARAGLHLCLLVPKKSRVEETVDWALACPWPSGTQLGSCKLAVAGGCGRDWEGLGQTRKEAFQENLVLSSAANPFFLLPLGYGGKAGK